MIKELLLAIFLGALLGFGITGGVVALKNNRSSQATSLISVSPTPVLSGTISSSPKPTVADTLDTNSHQITIDSPENESVVTNSQITLKGSTTPLSHLVITTPSKTYLTTADNAGNFNLDLEIDSGANQIEINSLDANDNQATTKIIITYSTAKI